MISEALQRARDFEAQYGPRIPDAERPAFHAAPPIGWMNDPNGFSFYRGECHLFYQYHPYSIEWGPMYWGHLKTRDFLHWERLPCALAPDQAYDAFGCFSGGAVELPDGRQLLMYTGVRRERDADGFLRDLQTQCLAVGDGVDYEKYDRNPVLDGADLPAGCTTADFRDPKVWREADGYRAALGVRTGDGSGAVLLCRSPDGFQWERAATLERSRGQYGLMWECPDYFPLDGRQVLIVSPQDMSPMGLEFHAGNGTVCFLGRPGPDGTSFLREQVQAVDYGLDFYAPQTLEAPDGRRIMIAWMQNWSTVGAKPPHCRWFGQMTLPRELSVRDGRLCQRPVRELDACRRAGTVHRGVPLGAETALPGVQGRVLDLTVSLRPLGPGSCRRFRLRVAKDAAHETVLTCDLEEDVLHIDRTRSGLTHDIVHTRTFPIRPRDGAVDLRVVLDRTSLEVFVNGGEQAASAVIYTPQEADAITFQADGRALVDVEAYELEL